MIRLMGSWDIQSGGRLEQWKEVALFLRGQMNSKADGRRFEANWIDGTEISWWMGRFLIRIDLLRELGRECRRTENHIQFMDKEISSIHASDPLDDENECENSFFVIIHRHNDRIIERDIF